ncbi:MAG: hypothetical protein L0I29_07125 [Hyphomicrobiales bacterium]|nr:hypothetical protein [Hyphomicrobiales bacterium]
MPFHSMVQDSVLTPEDLDFLQDIYEAAAAGIVTVDDAAMHDAVRTLIRYYRTGERDRDKLIASAAGELHRAVS